MMKKIAIAAAVLALGAVSANAADMPARMYTKAPMVAPIYNWTGFYIGGFVGGASAERNAFSNEPCAFVGGCGVAQFNVNPAFGGLPVTNSYRLRSSFFGGGTLGYNWQPAQSPWVIGIEGEGGYLNLRRTVLDANVATGAGLNGFDTTRIGNAYGIIAGRVGLTWNQVLFYGKGGVAFVEKRYDFTDTCTVAPCGPATLGLGRDHMQTTWAAGGGIEWAFAPSWSVKGEYLYIDTRENYSQTGIAGGTGAVAGVNFVNSHSDPGVHTAKVGVNYRWGGPEVARY